MKSEESLSKSRGRADQEKQSGVLPLILMPGLIAFFVGQLILALSETGLAPAISACVLLGYALYEPVGRKIIHYDDKS
ncbi:MAG: hypothetical protein SPL54_00415 [Lachnospiraceae bacterium]|nr:hypothetical protein [Lachnospiraceae bacterium]